MTRHTEVIPLLGPSPGTSRELIVHRYGVPGQGKKIYIQAALHADEWPGLMAVQHLLPLLDAADAAGDIQGQLVILPYANPIGLAQRVGAHVDGRYAFDGTGNFNRNWVDLAALAAPRLADRLSGEPDADIVAIRSLFGELIADLPAQSEMQFWRKKILELCFDADYVLDLHCDGEALVHIYANFRQEEIARNLCYDMECPVLLLENATGGGAFDSTVSAPWWHLAESREDAAHIPFPCFGATVELRGRQDIHDTFGARDAAGLMRFLRRQGIVAGQPNPVRTDICVSPLVATDVLNTPVAGIVSYPLELGTFVKPGDVIAYVIDPAAKDLEKSRVALRTKTAGIFFARNDQRLVAPGDSIAKVAGKEPLADRREGNLLEA